MAETEPPFRPREKIIEKQKYFQSVHKHTYLKGPMDKITSVAIPLALAGTSLFLIVSVFLCTVELDSSQVGLALKVGLTQFNLTQIRL